MPSRLLMSSRTGCQSCFRFWDDSVEMMPKLSDLTASSAWADEVAAVNNKPVRQADSNFRYMVGTPVLLKNQAAAAANAGKRWTPATAGMSDWGCVALGPLRMSSASAPYNSRSIGAVKALDGPS